MGLMQLNFEGKNKIEVAIDRIKEHAPPEGYYLADSGGKDSTVILHLATVANVKFDAHYCVSPIDPPQIHKFLRQFHPSTQWDYHARGFWKTVVMKGLPLRQFRWCCEIIKESGGKNRTVILGNRRAESIIRKKQKCFELGRKNNKIFLRPIIDWSTEEVWEYISLNELPYCSLYDDGFKRLGCVLCPFSREVELEMKFFPKITNLWRLACDRIVERRLASGKLYKHNFKTGQELFEWWIYRR